MIVALSGGSCSGKGFFLEYLTKNLQKRFDISAQIISMDNFYIDRSQIKPKERESINYDHPSAIDWRSFNSIKDSLEKGAPFKIPQYDFKNHIRSDNFKNIPSSKVFIIDGIFSLYKENITIPYDLSIFIEAFDSKMLERRIDRDVRERGRTKSSVIKQYFETVRPMYFKYIHPTRENADINILWNEFQIKKIELIANLIAFNLGSKD